VHVRDVRDLRLRELLVNVPVNALCGYRMWRGSGWGAYRSWCVRRTTESGGLAHHCPMV